MVAAGYWCMGLGHEVADYGALGCPGATAGPLCTEPGSGVGGCNAGSSGPCVSLLVHRAGS